MDEKPRRRRVKRFSVWCVSGNLYDFAKNIKQKNGFARNGTKPFVLLPQNLAAARMAAVAGNFRHVLAFCFLAMIAAILLTVTDRAVADLMTAHIIFVRHNQNLPCS
jgi:hypothetical protein